MVANDFLIKACHGKQTTLDKAYNRHIKKIIQTLDDELEGRWEVYNLIMDELINQGKSDCFNEFRYRLTDGENANSIILSIIEREGVEINGLIWLLKRRLEEYAEDDFIKRFYI